MQATVAQYLIKHPAAIVQLNMGEGKTRVILPMLALHWARGGEVVRLNFISTLLDEAFDFLHQHLCASMLRRKLFRMPFHRDVDLSQVNVRAMTESLEHCQRVCGILLVAPEHRMSLELKRHELHIAGKAAVCKDLSDLHRMSFVDIFDESDELLRHKYQLVYAAGAQMSLPSGQERWEAIQALCRIIKHDTDKVAQLLSDPLVARHELSVTKDIPAAFHQLRLIPGPEADRIMEELNVALMKTLIDSPPYHFEWLRQHKQSKQIIALTTNPKRGSFLIPTLKPVQQEALLAFRGLLAHGILRHCLEKRHRVNYGVSRKTGRKRLAVPFKANDTPSVPRACPTLSHPRPFTNTNSNPRSV